MLSACSDINVHLGEFFIEGKTFRYSSFMGRLYNFCKGLGFEKGKIMPSRAFCSDENQGYPVILIAKHFGCFPFNHGRVGGVVSTSRHGPFAEHGQDLVIIHASHVGYDPDHHQFGSYRRLQTEGCLSGPTCGKISGVLDWYLKEFDFSCQNIFLERGENGRALVTIDNQLLLEGRSEGLFLHYEKLIELDAAGDYRPIRSYSTSKSFPAAPSFEERVAASWPSAGRRAIACDLMPDLFYFKRDVPNDPESEGRLEKNILSSMSCVVKAPSPLLMAAQINTQVEFDRTYRSLVQGREFEGKRLVFISGLNIDISPREGQLFPLTKFVPWAAFVKEKAGSSRVIEQPELFETLRDIDDHNADQVDLEAAIGVMAHTEEVVIRT
ncbi:MAG: hypothetical protein KC652_23335 [Cyanobacteria bacterium HKST-UBA01]|nr:hypothetical protein [Cyanobacteria bacterium HKST-UBA01]